MDHERVKAASPENVEKSSDAGGAAGDRPTGTARLARRKDAAEAEPSLDALTCPVCGVKSPISEIFCGECGFMLMSKLEDVTSPIPSVEDLARYPHLEDASGRSFPLRPGVNTLGRENTDILLVDRSISRYHGAIVFDEDRDLFSVEDSGSTNGSRINGEPLPSHKPRSIRPGDQLTFGNIVLRFVAEGNAQVNASAGISAEVTTKSADGYLDDALMTEPSGRLELLRGNGPREIVIGQGVTAIGRTADNNICLPDDRYISGHHARIEVDGEIFLLLDVGSTNGTFLNGLRLTTNAAIAISNGDEILIGGLLFQFHKTSVPVRTDPALESTLIGLPGAPGLPLDSGV